jgi:fructose-bisphosphate aldolase class II
MIDASHEEFSKNVLITSGVVKNAHDKGIAVEAELGILSGVEDDIISEKSLYTDPDQAAEFVEKTKCDSLAIAIGTSHGAYKMKSTGKIRIDILKKIKALLPDFPIVLHGASNVSQSEVQRINNAGGKIKDDAKGISPEELSEAIKLGVSKINIATDLRIIWTRVHREFFNNSPEQFDPIIPGKEYIKELSQFVKNKCESFLVNPGWKF